MFAKRSWAEAFINSIEKEGGEIEEGLNTLIALASGELNLISGSSASEKLNTLIMKKMVTLGSPSGAQIIAIRFFLLMIKKNVMRHTTQIIGEIKKTLDRKRGIVEASIEYAQIDAITPADESRIKEAVKKWTKAAEVNLKGQLKTDLIGGYKLRIGDEVIDASISCQLRKMEACLSSGTCGQGTTPAMEGSNG